MTLRAQPLPTTAEITDVKAGKSELIPQDAPKFRSRTVQVLLGPAVPPSEGLPTSQYRVGFWARSDSGKATNKIASLVPEEGPIQIRPAV